MVKIVIEKIVSRQSVLFVEVPFILQKNVLKVSESKGKKSRAAGDSDNRLTELTPQNKIRCGSEYHLVAKFPKPPKDIEKLQNQVRFNERGNH